MACSFVDGEVEAVGVVTRMAGRFDAVTARATARAQISAAATETVITRSDEGIGESPLPNQRPAQRRGNEAASAVANALTCGRAICGGLIVWLALDEQGRLAGITLLGAGLTDFLDGRLAHLAGPDRRSGALLDGAADVMLLCGTCGAIVVLHPNVWRANNALLSLTAVIYLCGVAASLWRNRRFGDPRQVSAKVAGATLYAFAAVTLLGGVYIPALLELSAIAVAISSLETIVRAATIVIQPSARRDRSHRPQASKDVNSSTPPPSSNATSPAATVRDAWP